MDQLIQCGIDSEHVNHAPMRGNSAYLMADPKQRNARAAEKRKITLRLLRDEIWTVTEVIAILLGIKYSAGKSIV